MYPLRQSYGKKAFEQWEKNRKFDPGKSDKENIEKRERSLRRYQTDHTDARDKAEWEVSTFSELVDKVAFLSAMNKRLVLFYRGETKDFEHGKLHPKLFRNSWRCFCCQDQFNIDPRNRYGYWNHLQSIGQRVYKICHEDKKLGLPRWRGLKETREVQWSVIQHYGLWPTPLIDVTSSLRVAASFAMDHHDYAIDRQEDASAEPRSGYLYVVGMPQSTGSITFDIDQQVVIARLESSCPPIAKRPFYQDGFLVGRFPTYEIRRVDKRASAEDVEKAEKDDVKKADLSRRLIAKFKLTDTGGFWDDKENFPVIKQDALIPPEKKDPLLRRFREEFVGEKKELSIHREAQELEVAIPS